MVSSPAQAAPSSLLALDGFVLDLSRGVLTAEARELVLRPRTAAVLAHLLAHAGRGYMMATHLRPVTPPPDPAPMPAPALAAEPVSRGRMGWATPPPRPPSPI